VSAAPALSFVHQPVLLAEVLELAAVAARPQMQIVDCTVGGAGHAAALLDHFAEARLCGIDRDPTAVQVASQRLQAFGSRARVRHGKMSQVGALCADLPPVDLLLADFGVSSHQLDTPGRGFSFREDPTPQPLDMRMDPTQGESAADLIDRLEEKELRQIIWDLGEERRAGAVARAVKRRLPRTTGDLADCVRAVVRPAKDGLDPATRTFMALRMAVNDELGEIDAWLQQAADLLRDGGVLLAISFHSLEDRAVKRALLAQAQTCRCPPRLPVCVCTHRPTFSILTSKVRQASVSERHQNPRARSAKLRAAQRCSRGPC
jgi:16S rRNA (cytosine1402-N4)-methyltransferase